MDETANERGELQIVEVVMWEVGVIWRRSVPDEIWERELETLLYGAYGRKGR